MEFTLQKLVQQTLAEAEHRVKVAAAAEPEDKGSPAKASPSDNPSTAPERNEEGISEKTATVFVEKLAAAVQYLNENYLEKEAVGKPEPPTAHTPPQADKGLGAGKGTGAMETNLESPTTGMQSEETGQAKQQQIPTNPGQDVASPGQVNPATALETDMNAAPGGSEDWTNQDKMKQAGVGEAVSKGAKRVGQLLSGSKAKVLETSRQMGAGKASDLTKEKAKVWAARGAAALGTAGAAKGLHSAVKGKKKDEDSTKEASLAKAKDFLLKRKGMAGEAMSHLKGAVGKGNTLKERAVQVGRAIKASPETAAGAALGTAAAAKGVHSAAKGSTKEAQVSRILGIMQKMAADAENPASIGAKVTNPHQSSPEGASQAEEAVPSQPGEVSKQESMVGSNEKAINYTKQQAKAVPKARMGEVLDEPAQRKSSDPVLHQNLDAAGGAGVKLSSVEAGAAARVLLEKIAEEGASPDASPEQKERASKLQGLLQTKQQESEVGAPEPSMPVGGGY